MSTSVDAVRAAVESGNAQEALQAALKVLNDSRSRQEPKASNLVGRKPAARIVLYTCNLDVMSFVFQPARWVCAAIGGVLSLHVHWRRAFEIVKMNSISAWWHSKWRNNPCRIELLTNSDDLAKTIEQNLKLVGSLLRLVQDGCLKLELLLKALTKLIALEEKKKSGSNAASSFLTDTKCCSAILQWLTDMIEEVSRINLNVLNSNTPKILSVQKYILSHMCRGIPEKKRNQICKKEWSWWQFFLIHLFIFKRKWPLKKNNSAD